MSTAAPEGVRETEILRHQAGLVRIVVPMNLEGVTHEESLRAPQPAGNCANWVLGHLTCVYNNFLPLLGQQHAADPQHLARYDRGSAPIEPATALPLDELRGIWDTAVDRVEAGLAALDADTLRRTAPFSPSGDPNETVGSLCSTVMFHQTYHAGQLGILRRITGHEGAIK